MSDSLSFECSSVIDVYDCTSLEPVQIEGLHVESNNFSWTIFCLIIWSITVSGTISLIAQWTMSFSHYSKTQSMSLKPLICFQNSPKMHFTE